MTIWNLREIGRGGGIESAVSGKGEMEAFSIKGGEFLFSRVGNYQIITETQAPCIYLLA
jgi:hypothetical protein